MKSTDWIVCRQKGLTLECRRCGATDALRLPATVSVWVAAAQAFTREHRDCKAQEPS